MQLRQEEHQMVSNFKQTFFILLLLLSTFFTVSGYTVYSGCPDLTNLSASYVEAYTGRTWEPMQNKGVVEGRHTVITTQGTDPYTDNKLKFIPDGATKVVRLGNDLAEAETDVLIYHFRVDANNPILKLRYAVVMENPGHAKSEQPHFNLHVLDASGKLVNSYSSYEVYASADAAGFHTSKQTGKLGSSIIWRDWTSMGVDLSDMVGREVQIRITTYDCGAFEHFAYAYFTAECIEKKITIENCQSSSFKLVAPEGFVSYQWSTGSTDRTITVSNNQAKQTISCKIKSASGSSFTLYMVLSNTSIATGKTISETVIAGDEFAYEGIKLPTENSGAYSFDYYNIKTCSFLGTNNVGITAQKLPAKKTYIDVKKGICEGESYKGYGFSYIEPATGTYRDTLPCTTCTESYPQYYALELVVSQAPVFPTIKGPLDVCEGESVVYRAVGAENLSSYQWTYKEDGEQKSVWSSSLTREFPSSGSETITLLTENSCQSKTQSIKVNVHPNYKKVYFDTVCVGTKYSRYGFYLGVLNEEGKIVRNKNLQTVHGCDSLVVLSLFVAPEVKVRIDLTGDSVLCEGKEVKLTAKGGLDYEEKEEEDRIKVGDIHCTDGTILHPADFAKSGKTADGVVVYLDETGEHGRIVSVTETQYYYAGSTGKNLRNDYELYRLLYIGEISKIERANYDVLVWNGFELTQAIEQQPYLENNIFLKDLDTSTGWYLPSLGEMHLLYSSLVDIEKSFAIAGATSVDLESLYITSNNSGFSCCELSCYTWSAMWYDPSYPHDFLTPLTLHMRQFKKF